MWKLYSRDGPYPLDRERTGEHTGLGEDIARFAEHALCIGSIVPEGEYEDTAAALPAPYSAALMTRHSAE